MSAARLTKRGLTRLTAALTGTVAALTAYGVCEGLHDGHMEEVEVSLLAGALIAAALWAIRWIIYGFLPDKA